MGGQKHTPTRDEETKGGLRTANTDGEGQSTHALEMRRQRGVLERQIQMGEDKSTHFLEIRRQWGV